MYLSNSCENHFFVKKSLKTGGIYELWDNDIILKSLKSPLSTDIIHWIIV